MVSCCQRLGGHDWRQPVQGAVQGRQPRAEARDAEVDPAEPRQGAEHELERSEGQLLRRGKEGLSISSMYYYGLLFVAFEFRCECPFSCSRLSSIPT